MDLRKPDSDGQKPNKSVDIPRNVTHDPTLRNPALLLPLNFGMPAQTYLHCDGLANQHAAYGLQNMEMLP